MAYFTQGFYPTNCGWTNLVSALSWGQTENQLKKLFAAIVLASSAVLLAGNAPMAAIAVSQAPTLPEGQVLNSFGYYPAAETASWNPSIDSLGLVPTVLDATTAIATVTPAGRAELNTLRSAEITNAGYEESTGLVWTLFRNCELWSISPDGTSTTYDLASSLPNPYTGVDDCFALLIQNNRTALVSATLAGGATQFGLFTVDLATGLIVPTSIVNVGHYLGGLAKNPVDQQIWTSVVWDSTIPNGLYKFDPTTGALAPSSNIPISDLWGLAFDRNGILWATDWGSASGDSDCATYSCLSYIDPMAGAPASTFGSLGVMQDREGTYNISSGLWITTSSAPDPTPVPPTEPALAKTGANSFATTSVAITALVVGIALIARATLRRRKIS